MKLWLKADSGLTLDANNRASAWEDASGNGNDASAAAATVQPLWVDGVINGKPVLRFDGAANSLSAC